MMGKKQLDDKVRVEDLPDFPVVTSICDPTPCRVQVDAFLFFEIPTATCA